MKKTLLIVFLITLTFDVIKAQNIPGVTQIAAAKNGASFIHRDDRNRLWLGFGGGIVNGFRYSNGLYYIDSNNNYVTQFNKGTFTDILEWKGKTYITAIDGLYEIDGDSITRTPTMYNSLCITGFKDSLVIGSLGYGLYFWKDNNFSIIRIKIKGRYLDSIYDVVDRGNELFIATNSGLVKYADGQFTIVEIPIVSLIDLPNRRKIMSVAKDGNNNIWFSNATASDTISNLFRIEDGVVIDVRKRFVENCYRRDFIPYPIYKLHTARNGSILIGTHYGLVEVTEVIKQFIVSKLIDNLEYLKFEDNTSNTSAPFEDIDGKYIVSNRLGVFEIDRTLYTLENYRDAMLTVNKRSNKQINLNDIDASISNDGIFFNGPDVVRQWYKEKILGLRSRSNNCGNLMYTSGQFLSAMKPNDTIPRVSACFYRTLGTEFTPGPINLNTLERDSILVNKFNKIWVVYKKDIDDFIKNRLTVGYSIPQSLIDWPANAISNTHSEMAPFVDADANGIYDPSKGDYPKIKGDVMYWWVFNDIADHKTSYSKPLKIQVNASCYAYNDLRINETDPDFIVNRTLLFDFKYINLSGNDYNDFNIGIFNDVEIGDYTNDAVGSDSSLNLGFGYNNTNNDRVLGNNPPIVACKFLNRPMNHFVATAAFNFGSDTFKRVAQYYYVSRSKSMDFNGNVTSKPNFEYPQLPCQTTQTNVYADKRFIMTTDIGELKKNASVNLEMAYFVQYDPTKDYLKEHCDELKSNANKIQNWYNTNSFPSKSYWSTELTDIKDITLEVYPNPSTGLYKAVASSDIHVVKVFDVLGNMIFSQNVDGNEAVINLQTYNSGIYILHVETAAGTLVKKLVKS